MGDFTVFNQIVRDLFETRAHKAVLVELDPDVAHNPEAYNAQQNSGAFCTPRVRELSPGRREVRGRRSRLRNSPIVMDSIDVELSGTSSTPGERTSRRTRRAPR